MQTTQATLELGDVSQTQSASPDTLAEGETRWMGNWQVRNFKGYFQSREGGAGTWRFQVSTFDATSTGQHGSCSLILADGGACHRPYRCEGPNLGSRRQIQPQPLGSLSLYAPHP